MKLFISLSLLALFYGCSYTTQATPKQKSALEKYSPTATDKKEKGILQIQLDKWLQGEWQSSIDKNETLKKRENDKSRSFKLQDFVDKAVNYYHLHKDDNRSSHQDSLQKLPVINVKRR